MSEIEERAKQKFVAAIFRKLRLPASPDKVNDRSHTVLTNGTVHAMKSPSSRVLSETGTSEDAINV